MKMRKSESSYVSGKRQEYCFEGVERHLEQDDGFGCVDD